MSKDSNCRRKTQVSESLGSSILESEVLPRLRTRSLAGKSRDFNKYYVRPSLRYRRREENPKESPEKYEDEAYIYKNLHNHRYWNWNHPLQAPTHPQATKSLSSIVSIPALQKFKSYIDTLPNKRLPLLIQEILTNKI